MTGTYAALGRTRQKQRTRAALKAAAAELLGQGHSPTVEEVADAAQVSRSTAYRYFSSREALQAEVVLDSAVSDGIDQILTAARRSSDAVERLVTVVHEDHALVTDHETAFRKALQTFVAPVTAPPGRLPARPGNRLRYLTAALEPLGDRLGPVRFQQLLAALALCVGIESLVVTQDICNLNPAEAERLKQWAARALLNQAILEADAESTAGRRT